MKFKGKKVFKGLTAALLCVILIATSLPLAVFASGAYNPCPYFPFPNEDTENPTARRYAAYTNSDGSITVDFPRAFANNERKSPEKKYVKGYLIELVDLGEKTTLHTNKVLLRFTMEAQGKLQYEYVITADQIRAVSGLENGLLSNHNYNVSITAYDNEGWFSDTLNTAVSDIPVFAPKSDFVPLVTDNNAVRAMLNMESNGKYGGAYILTGTEGALSVIGAVEQTGVENYTADIEGNTTAKDSVGYGFTLRNIADDGTPEGFMTVYSREMWDYSGVEEVWLWLDLTHVDLYGLAFQMCSNEKTWHNNTDGGGSGGLPDSGEDQEDYFTSNNNIFSTAGYVQPNQDAPKNPYCYLQQEDGSWRKVEMPNGTMDLGHFRGYVRVPVEFFCLTKDSVVYTTNNKWTEDVSDTAMTGNGHRERVYSKDDAYGFIQNTYAQRKWANPVVVDPAGTPITDALLIQHYGYRGAWCSRSSWPAANNNKWTFPDNGYPLEDNAMLAAGLTRDDIINGTNRRATINETTWEVENRENGYKAIEDMAAAGFSFKYASESSLDRSFFIDNVLFYRTDGQGFPNDGNGNTGEPISNYYNQKYEIPRAIFYSCNQYISDDPGWGDFRAVRNIEAMIDYYKQAFAAYGWDTGFMSETELASTARLLKMEKSWQKFLTAREACKESGTFDSDNNEPHELVPQIVSMIEKMPDPTTSLLMSAETQKDLKRIFQIYNQLSLDQLDMLGRRNEEKLLTYYSYMESLLRRNSVPVGDTLAATPYIMFNDFESFSVGTQALQLEDDPNAGNPGSQQPNTGLGGNYHRTDVPDLSTTDYRFKKALVTYTGSAFKMFSGHTSDNATSDAGMADTLGNNLKNSGDFRRNAAWATVDNNGFMGTNGLTMTIDSQYYKNNEGEYNAVSFTRKGAADENPAVLRQQNTGLDGLGDFASSNITVANGANPPISLVFYCDFSQLSNFRLSVIFHAYCPNHDDYGDPEFEDFALDFGSDSKNRRFWLLSPNTGEWIQCDVDGKIYTLPSSSSGNDGVETLSLNGYKGYIMIPLQYFLSGRRGALNIGGYDYALSTDAPALNSIYRIQIGVAPNGSDADAANLDGRSFTIDNVGFSYDPSKYTTQYAQRKDINFDEMTDSKSLWSVDFAEIVNSIDPYDEANFARLLEEAEAKYNSLTDYQKTHQSVKAAKALYDKYKDWFENGLPEPEAPYNTFDAVKQAIAALPSQMTRSDSVTGDSDLPYPYDITTDSIDYSKYGINGADEATCRAEAKRIVELYENSYARLPKAEKDRLTDAEREAILNAYNAALRLQVLEAALDDAHGFKEDFEKLYTAPDNVRPDQASKYFFSIQERDDLIDLWDGYRGMTYWTKYMLENMEGTMSDQSEDVIWTLQRLLKNTRTYSIDYPAENTSSSLNGGVIQLLNTYKKLYENTKSAIKGREKVDLDTLKAAYEEYESLVPAYYSIKELYDIWYEEDDNYSSWDNSGSYPKWNETSSSDGFADGILALFPVNVTGLNGDEDTSEVTINLTSENYKAGESATYNVLYSVYLDWLTNKTDVKYVTVESENGKMVLSDTNQEAEYKVSVSGGATVNTTSANLTTETKLNNVANNTYTKNSPLNFEIKVSFDEEPDVQLPVSDKLILRFYHEDGTEIEELQKTINVTYTPDDSYEVYIPAEFTIEWDYEGDEPVSYEVVTYLSEGASLDVSVAQAKGETPNVLVNAATGDTLPITTANFGTQSFTGIITQKTLPSPVPTLTVTDWSKPIDKYETQLTYTVTFNPASP